MTVTKLRSDYAPEEAAPLCEPELIDLRFIDGSKAIVRDGVLHFTGWTTIRDTIVSCA